MLKSIVAKNVGPIPEMVVDFGSRINIMTGDNGLGKTFLLDMIWYALTRKWPVEVNPNMESGLVGRPQNPRNEATIDFSLMSNANNYVQYQSKFDRVKQAWVGQVGRPYNAGLVVYAMADGSFCVWDPAKNYWTHERFDSLERPSAFVFTSRNIWNGLKDGEKSICNGLIIDLLKWQDKQNFEYECMTRLLDALSPSDFRMSLDAPTRISIDDVRDIPTIRMPYGVVPVLHASAAIRRILSLAYCLTWTFSEHRRACDIRGLEPASQITFLMDEVDAHLHPNWQRKIMKALQNSIEWLTARSGGNVQIIASTHSPLVMASLEDFFDARSDKWLDFDFESNGTISFAERDFEKQGTPEAWLKSKAFDLKDTRSEESSRIISQIYDLLNQTHLDNDRIKTLYFDLVRKLSPLDNELFLIRYICERKGVL